MSIPNITWHSLKRLGQSRVASLSVFFPFVGYLILFNEHIVDILQLVPEILSRHSGAEGVTTTLHRLYWLYGGLSALGIASFLYTLFCPEEIKSFDSSTDMLEAGKKIATQSNCIRDLRSMIAFYAECDSKKAFIFKGSCTLEYREFTEDVLTAMTRDVLKLGSFTEEDIFGNEMQSGLGVLSGIDNVNIERVVDLLRSRLRVTRAFSERFENLATSYIVDITISRYIAYDHSRPFCRLAIVSLYVFGFTFLAIPTLMTFFQIFVRAS